MRRTAWLFKDGSYPDKGLTADAEYLRRTVANTRAAGCEIPLDLEHAPTEQVLDFGRLLPDTLRVEHGCPPHAPQDATGHWIVGDVEIDPAVSSRLRTNGLSVLLHRGKQILTKVAVTAAPRVAHAAFSADDPEVIDFGGYLMPDDTQPTPAPEPGAVTDQPAEVPPADSAPFSDPRVRAILAQRDAEVAALTQRLTGLEAEVVEMATGRQADRIDALTTRFHAAGVPPWLVSALVPLAAGAETATVAFTEGGQTATRELTAAEVAMHVLEQMQQALPRTSRLSSTDDGRDAVSFSDAVATEARRLQAAEPSLSFADAVDKAVPLVRQRGIQED